MKIAVITAYYKEPIEILRRCHASVMKQGVDVTHFMVSDGFPNPEIDTWENTVHLHIPNHGDYGDTPRGIGAASAVAKGYDGVAFLDADNWYDPNHLITMQQGHQQSGAAVLTSTRRIVEVDETVLGVCVESNGKEFNDTNCYFITATAFPVLAAWLFKSKGGIVGDRVFWKAVVEGGYSRAHCSTATVNYTSTLAFHYQMFGKVPPADSKVIVRYPGSEEFTMISFADHQRITSRAK